MQILKELREDNFGQNRAKRGVCLQVRILKDLKERLKVCRLEGLNVEEKEADKGRIAWDLTEERLNVARLKVESWEEGTEEP